MSDDVKQIIQAAASLIIDTVLELIQNDSHCWSDRPCQTCQAISSLVGKPFGCYKYQADMKRK